jgi:phage terminase large subunit-like protein
LESFDPDWQTRIRTGQSPIPELPFLDEVAAQRAVNVFDRPRLPDVTGKPLLKDAAGDWFREIVRALHGSIVNGERIVREPLLLIPKKSSKTSYGPALMLTSLLINERPKAEFLLIAPTQPIAEIAFNQVEGMIAADARLRRRDRHAAVSSDRAVRRNRGKCYHYVSWSAGPSNSTRWTSMRSSVDCDAPAALIGRR